MPLLTLHLLRLSPNTEPRSFVQKLQSDKNGVKIVVASVIRFPVVRSEVIDASTLSTKPWDLMLLLQVPSGSLPSSLRASIADEYKICVGVPSKLLSAYPAKNQKLRDASSQAELTGSLDNSHVPDSSQNLTLSPEILNCTDELLKTHGGPVTQLNLLHFKKDRKAQYYQYGQRFVKVNEKRGGDAKIVGNVIPPPSGQTDSRSDSSSASEWWDEVAIVHYPSIKHFCDMLAGDDYQAINNEFRLPALKDTLLWCTTELEVMDSNQKARL
ncbi:hypothetical protein LTR66_007666 [Elasticomyces elasticus]|nr:hypothetical protein LTR66_007666 [Elasticomyces elasticus]